MPDIENFLKTKTDSGQYQSSGDFTVSPEKALEKVREFNFAGPFDWVLALIQAGHLVPGKVKKIDILGTRKGIELHLRGAQPGTLEALHPLILSLEKTTPTLEAFRRCAWGLLNTSRFTIRQSDLVVRWAEGSLTEETVERGNKVGERDLIWEVIDNSVTDEHGFRKSALRARILLDLKAAVEEKAYHSSVPLLLDRRSLKTSPSLGGNSLCSPLVIARGKPGLNVGQLIKQPWNEPRLLHSEPLFQFEHKFSALTITYCCRLDLSPVRPGQSLKRPYLEPSRSSLRLNKNGVIVYQQFATVPTPVSCHIIANCDTLRTDITQLAARQEDALEFMSTLEKQYGLTLNEIALKLWEDVNRAISTKPFIFDHLTHPPVEDQEAKPRGFLDGLFSFLSSDKGSLLGPMVLRAVRESKEFHLQ